jgi:serine/threonine-protein kinase RsbW
LENLVVLETTRTLATAPDTTVEFACSFAMPPLTRCWYKKTEPRNNPKFNADRMAELLSGASPVGACTSYSALLRDCLQNSAHLPVVPYAGSGAEYLCDFGGPSGALLAALLIRRHGQTVRLWSNDLVNLQARYRGTPTPNAATECPRTNTYADALSAGAGGHPGVDAFCDQAFPGSIPAMAAWRGQCVVRIGFLDPDSYVAGNPPGPGQVDTRVHSRWLTELHRHAVRAAGIMFFANRNASRRPALIAAFHNDALADYPRSVVFRHRSYMVGVKLRCHMEDSLPLIIAGVQGAWAAWSALVGRDADGLSCYVKEVPVTTIRRRLGSRRLDSMHLTVPTTMQPQREPQAPSHHVVISSDPAEARRVQEHIEQLLQESPCAERDLFSIKLALEEALVNAIKHGNQYDRNKKVEIAYQVLPDRFVIRITDEGTGFDPADVPDPTAVENLERPCGRGLMLMKHYMSEITYNERGNSVQMSKLFRSNNGKK